MIYGQLEMNCQTFNPKTSLYTFEFSAQAVLDLNNSLTKFQFSQEKKNNFVMSRELGNCNLCQKTLSEKRGLKKHLTAVHRSYRVSIFVDIENWKTNFNESCGENREEFFSTI